MDCGLGGACFCAWQIRGQPPSKKLKTKCTPASTIVSAFQLRLRMPHLGDDPRCGRKPFPPHPQPPWWSSGPVPHLNLHGTGLPNFRRAEMEIRLLLARRGGMVDAGVQTPCPNGRAIAVLSVALPSISLSRHDRLRKAVDSARPLSLRRGCEVKQPSFARLEQPDTPRPVLC